MKELSTTDLVENALERNLVSGNLHSCLCKTANCPLLLLFCTEHGRTLCRTKFNDVEKFSIFSLLKKVLYDKKISNINVF